MDRDAIANAIREALTEDWHNADNGDRWKSDILLVGCQRVNNVGYEKPEEAAQNLALLAADAVLALMKST